MKQQIVSLEGRSYPIIIGRGILGESKTLQPYIISDQILVVTNETIAPLYLAPLKKGLISDYHVDELVLPDGEKYKTMGTCLKIIDALLENQHRRNTTLIALGGGVIGDMTGFAAAMYQRGANFIQVPTTLLAQVDSSVGGKTGVNHPLGKNMLGAFHQPQCVLVDLDTLDTLPQREFVAGLAEVIKAGLLGDSDLFTYLEQNSQAILNKDPEVLAYIIERSCAIKADIVAQDERENGCRALLNLGHTFGHAIETGLGYKDWLHGEAVACGMVLAAKLSCKINALDEGALNRIEKLVTIFGLPREIPKELSVQELIQSMRLDKKNVGKGLRLITLENIGKAAITEDINENMIKQLLEGY